MKEVLIAYGTRYGSTEEISRYISEILENKGLNTTLLNLKGLKPNNFPNLSKFSGVLIGSGIKIAQWTKETKKFLEITKDFLKGNKKILGVFLSCGNARDPERILKARKEYIEVFLAQKEIIADLYDAFGGIFDLSKNSNVGFLGKKMLKTVLKNEKDINLNERNDFRDWNQIKKFAENYAKLVQNSK